MSSDEIDFLMKMCESQGVGCSTVKDGHVLVFKRSFLKELVSKHEDQENLIIFVKRQDFNN